MRSLSEIESEAERVSLGFSAKLPDKRYVVTETIGRRNEIFPSTDHSL